MISDTPQPAMPEIDANALLSFDVRSDPQLVQRFRVLARGATIAVIVIGICVLLGWVADIATLKSLIPGYVSMKVNTALAFTLAGTSLAISQGKDRETGARLAAYLLATLVLFIGSLTLFEYLSGLDLGIDQLLAKDGTTASGTHHPGRMAILSAFSFLLFGILLLRIGGERTTDPRPEQGLALGVAALALIGLVGYFYGVSSYYTLARFSQMAIHTVASFLLLSVGVLGS
ncbi:hypothetical protein ACYOEI_29100, partial [Singulisphaera rosea]